VSSFKENDQIVSDEANIDIASDGKEIRPFGRHTGTDENRTILWVRDSRKKKQIHLDETLSKCTNGPEHLGLYKGKHTDGQF
jgi:hypothetical protein